MNNKKSVYKKLLYILKDYKLELFVSFLLSILVVVFNLFIPILIGKIIDLISINTQISNQKIIYIILFMFVLMLCLSIFSYIMSYINSKVVYKVLKKLRIKAFCKIHKLQLSYVDSHSHGDIISLIVNDIDQFGEGVLLSFTSFVTGVFTIILTLIVMFCINVKITCLIFVFTPISLLVARFISKKIYKYFQIQAQKRALLTSYVDEMIDGIYNVKTFCKEEEVEKEFDDINEQLDYISLKSMFSSTTVNPSTRVINAFIYAIVLINGAFLLIDKSISLGELSIFLSYASAYAKPFNEISSILSELQNSLACISRVFNFLDEDELLEDKKECKTLKNIKGNVRFSNVCFSYSENSKFVENLNIDIKAGQKVALVGETGCGKSTIINLLMRFYEVSFGDIYIDDINIKDIKREDLYSCYAMVLQDTWLKCDSIKNNITMKNENITLEELERVSKETYLDKFIKKLPNAFDTVISSSNENISIGQKQLISIARVMLKKAPILILDEATSCVDSNTEKNIVKAFDKLMEGKTSFIVAHRLATIKNSDVILVMDNGKIIEQGNHTSLINLKGKYYDMYMAGVYTND